MSILTHRLLCSATRTSKSAARQRASVGGTHSTIRRAAWPGQGLGTSLVQSCPRCAALPVLRTNVSILGPVAALVLAPSLHCVPLRVLQQHCHIITPHDSDVLLLRRHGKLRRLTGWTFPIRTSCTRRALAYQTWRCAPKPEPLPAQHRELCPKAHASMCDIRAQAGNEPA